MNRITLMLAAVLVTGLLSGCKQKKQSEDIIVHKTEEPQPQGPIRMQEYKQVKDFKWLGKDYQADIRRVPDDSLRMVKDETGAAVCRQPYHPEHLPQRRQHLLQPHVYQGLFR